ncbi:GAF domain-containing protein [Trichloromonas sp.]|uniref:GAF domain-containing protein n=1 Tax=Trichloromonas sp. TaxID=3069249 RepID=UPI003D813A5D
MVTGGSVEYFRLFFEAGQAILSSRSLQETLGFLVQRTASALGVKAGSLRLLNEKTSCLELVASHGLSPKYLAKGVLSADQSIPEVLRGEVVIVRDAFADPRIQYPGALREEGINTILSVPVEAGRGTVGVLRVYAAESRSFSDEEIEFVSALAELGGLAIANARIYETEGIRLSSMLKEVGVELSGATEVLQKRIRMFSPQRLTPEKSLQYFRALHETTRLILATLDSREVMGLIVSQVIQLMQVKACALRLINETTHELELLASEGLSEKFLRKGTPHTDRSIQETLEGVPVLISDTRSDARLEYPEATVAEGIASILSLPIVARERVIGVLRVYSGCRREFSMEEVTFLSALAEIAGIAIMNARLYEKNRNDLSFWTATMEYLQDQDP